MCYDYTPHLHPERLEKAPPKTKEGQFIALCLSSDIAFASPGDRYKILNYAAKYLDRTFLIQSKAPDVFKTPQIPRNVIIGTTIETNHDALCKWASKAPTSYQRHLDLYHIPHDRKFITIEPVLEYDVDIMWGWVMNIKPEFVYIGYDTKDCHLPEPALWKVKSLIYSLKNADIEVREKTIRKAWWE
jgi:hypothetical protein